MSSVDARAVVDPGAVIGDGCTIHPFAVIGPGVTLGQSVEVFPGAVIGKAPARGGPVLRDTPFERTVVIGDRCSIGPHSVIYYDVVIGSETLIGDAASIRENSVIGNRCIISRHVTVNYNCHVGDRTKVMDMTHLTGNMRIGSDVFVSVNVTTVNDNAIGGAGYDEARVVGPTIEDGAMIGAGAILLPGVRIGRAALVAGGSVVTKDVEPGARVFGPPARPREQPAK